MRLFCARVNMFSRVCARARISSTREETKSEEVRKKDLFFIPFFFSSFAKKRRCLVVIAKNWIEWKSSLLFTHLWRANKQIFQKNESDERDLFTTIGEYK